MIPNKKRSATDAEISSPEVSDADINASDDENSGSHRSSSAPEELAPNTIKYQLRSCLSQVQYVGSFMASQICQKIVDPGLYIEGIGNIRLPLGLSDAQAIMNIGIQAPFGRGTDTVVDIEFRNTMQLNPDRFRLRNPAWQGELQAIICRLCAKLGFNDETSGIQADLHKLLLYQQGAMFKPHKDSEKAEGMFGTLIICLSSEHSGGTLVLSHCGEKVTFETAAASEFGQSHVAWYSDVLHEIQPVKSGYRLVLTYNLIRKGYRGPNSAAAVTHEKTTLQNILHDWNIRYEAKQPTLFKLVYIFDHKYSEANLRLDRLKGRDRLIGRYFSEICEKEDFALLFGNLTLAVLDEDRSREEEEPEKTLELSNIITTKGKLLLHDATIDEQEILQENRYDRFPDEVKEEETGNEGVDTTHLYHDAVAIVMPAVSQIVFQLDHLDAGNIIEWIRVLASNVNDKDCRDKLIRICKFEAKGFNPNKNGLVMPTVIKACSALRQAELLLHLISGYVAWASHLGDGISEALAEALYTFPFSEVKQCFDNITGCPNAIHKNLTIIKTIGSHYQDCKPESVTSSKLSDLEAWGRARIVETLESAEELVPEDAAQLVGVAKRFGADMTEKHIIPILKKHHTSTAAAICCLAELFDAGRKNDLPIETARYIFDKTAALVISDLSFKSIFPKETDQEVPYVHPDFRYGSQDDFIADRVASFYCQCISIDLQEEADSVLNWLKREANKAHISIFHAFMFPFMPNLCMKFQQYGVDISQKHKETCQHMVLAFLRRCVGMEPAKTPTWARDPQGCRSKECSLCPKLDDFLEDPSVEVSYFKDAWSPGPINMLYKGHLHYQISRTYSGHECTPDYKMENGEKMLKVKKGDQQWSNAHWSWTDRCEAVKSKLCDVMRAARPLLREKYAEFIDMRPIKLPV